MFFGQLLSEMGLVLWLTLPLFGANMLAVLTGRGGDPIDGGRTWSDGQRILGDGKTWQGLLLAPLFAVAITQLLSWATYGNNDLKFLTRIWFYGPWEGWLPMLSLAYGALIGDVVKSFFKRRGRHARGAAWPFWDQFDAVVGGFAVCAAACLLAGSTWFYENLIPGRWLAIAIWLPLYWAIHRLASWAAYRHGLKSSST